MKSNMTIKCEFLAGASISDAVEEAKHQARRLGVAYVEFDFNGVTMSIGQNCDIEKAVSDFEDCLKSEMKFGVVQP